MLTNHPGLRLTMVRYQGGICLFVFTLSCWHASGDHAKVNKDRHFSVLSRRS